MNAQAYRKDSRERLELQMRAAREEGFRFGVKLVRGAYMQVCVWGAMGSFSYRYHSFFATS